MTETNKTYLGDGVYVSYDGYHVVLRTNDNTIYLDAYTLQEFLNYVERLREDDKDAS